MHLTNNSHLSSEMQEKLLEKLIGMMDSGSAAFLDFKQRALQLQLELQTQQMNTEESKQLDIGKKQPRFEKKWSAAKRRQ